MVKKRKLLLDLTHQETEMFFQMINKDDKQFQKRPCWRGGGGEIGFGTCHDEKLQTVNVSLENHFSLFLNALAPYWISILHSRVYIPTHLSESRRRSSLGPGPLIHQWDKHDCNELEALGRQKGTDSDPNIFSMLSQSKLLSWFVHMFLLLETCFTPTLLPVVLTTNFRQRQACRILVNANLLYYVGCQLQFKDLITQTYLSLELSTI